MEKLLQSLKMRHSGLSFQPGSSFYWSPAKSTVFYKQSAEDVEARWALLHETGHALLGHKAYALDFELLELELAAWQQAKTLAAELEISIDDEHIEDCLDTYRSWLYRRSICPACEAVALQEDAAPKYRCFNCGCTWQVAPSRFCRPYRALRANKNSSET